MGVTIMRSHGIGLAKRKLSAMGSWRERFLRIGSHALVATALWAIVPLPAAAQPNHQSCMVVGCASGPMLNTSYGMNTRSFGGCPTTCAPTGSNIYLCQQAGPYLLAHFSMSTSDTTMRGCDFFCAGQTALMQHCSIRGGDGLPVELLSFGVD